MNLSVTNEGLTSNIDDLKTYFEAENAVYEVLRIVDGVALFIEDHYSRLMNSIKLQGLQFQASLPEFKHHLSTLISANNKTAGNVKVVCMASENEIKWAYSFIAHSYPSVDDYKLGVATGLLFAQRNNPNAKVIQSALRTKANQMMADANLYEVLLVNQHGLITEGSRSNVFFVKSGVLYTAPTSLVLEGITRQKVVQCIQKLNLKFEEKAVSYHELMDFDAAFISGTSPKVLPVRLIDNHELNVTNEVMKLLMNEYDELIQNYIASYK